MLLWATIMGKYGYRHVFVAVYMIFLTILGEALAEQLVLERTNSLALIKNSPWFSRNDIGMRIPRVELFRYFIGAKELMNKRKRVGSQSSTKNYSPYLFMISGAAIYTII